MPASGDHARVAPVVEQPGPTAAPASASRILIVDDNTDGAEMMGMVLERMGFETRVAHDGITALEIAAEFVPDTAFLDIGLPVMDGYELAAHLRQVPGLAGIRLIALTGYGQESDRKKSAAAGFDAHIVKPADTKVIRETLAR